MRRMAAILTGRDGLAGVTGAGTTHGPPDNVEAQGQRLVLQAASHENLCQSYIGLCVSFSVRACASQPSLPALTRALICAAW